MPQNFNVGGMQINKTTAYISLAAAVGIIGYAYWQRQVNNAAPNDSGTATDTTGDIDPVTGLPYADEYGFDSTGYSGIGYSGLGFLDPVTGQTIGAYGQQTITQVSTNAQWVQLVVAYLEQHDYQGMAVTSALGKVLAGVPITDDELHIWQAAIAVEGQPPQPFPPIVHVPSGSTNPPPGGNAKPGKVTNLHASFISTSSIRIAWTPVSGATNYSVYMPGATGWQTIGNTSTTTFTRTGLRRSTRYRFQVAAKNNAGTGTRSSTLTVATHGT